MKHGFFFFTNTTCWRWKIIHLMLFLVPANGWFQDLDICSIWWYSVLPAHVIEYRTTMSRWNEFHGIYIVGQKMWKRSYSLTGCIFFSYSFRNLTITKQMYFPWNIWTQQGLCQTSAEKLGKSSVYGIVVAIGRSKWSFALSLMRFSHDMVCWKHSLGAKNCCHKTICWFRIAIVFHLTDEAK